MARLLFVDMIAYIRRESLNGAIKAQSGGEGWLKEL